MTIHSETQNVNNCILLHILTTLRSSSTCCREISVAVSAGWFLLHMVSLYTYVVEEPRSRFLYKINQVSGCSCRDSKTCLRFSTANLQKVNCILFILIYFCGRGILQVFFIQSNLGLWLNKSAVQTVKHLRG